MAGQVILTLLKHIIHLKFVCLPVLDKSDTLDLQEKGRHDLISARKRFGMKFIPQGL